MFSGWLWGSMWQRQSPMLAHDWTSQRRPEPWRGILVSSSLELYWAPSRGLSPGEHLTWPPQTHKAFFLAPFFISWAEALKSIQGHLC